jgi:hypothetical protein
MEVYARHTDDCECGSLVKCVDRKGFEKCGKVSRKCDQTHHVPLFLEQRIRKHKMGIGVAVLDLRLRCDATEKAQRIGSSASGAWKSDFLVITFLADFLVLLLDPSYLRWKGMSSM